MGHVPFSLDAIAAQAWNEDPETSTASTRLGLMAERHGNRPAVVLTASTGSRTATYAEIDERATKVASGLVDRLGRSDARVVVLVENEIDHVVALFGVYRAGLTAVPLNSGNPPARLEYLVDHAGAGLVIADAQSARIARELFDDRAVELSTLEKSRGRGFEEVVGTSPAHILYTSGSTGEPKGVVQSHEFLLYKARSDAAFYALTEEDRLAQLFPLTFAAASTHLYGALLNGASMHVFDLTRLGMDRMTEWVGDSAVTGLATISTLFRRAFASVDRTYGSLRYIFLGAEAVTAADAALARRVLPDEGVLIQQMGSSETLVMARFVVDASTELSESVIPAGFAPPDKELAIVDDAGNPVPEGEAGNLIVKAPSMSEGYWANPELTAAAFGRDGDLLTFDTGDLARRHADGYIIHMGRKDARVKIRGYGVDLVEVERTLLGIRGTTEGAVKVWDEDGQTRLAAYYVGDSLPAELREHFSELVPDYMIPSYFVPMEALPLTDRGKINRGALGHPRELLELEPPVLPDTETEERLAKLWASALGVDEIGVTHSFFDLGGSSIQAYQLVADIHRELGVELAASTMLQARTIREQAALIDSGADTSASSLVAIRESGKKRPLFAVHGRGGGIVYLSKLEPYIDAERPIYALQPEMTPGVMPEYMSIEEMAAQYLAEVRTVQPEGPYVLAGSCYGGLVAAEMARQLESVGQTTDMVVLIDPPHDAALNPDNRPDKFTWWRRRMRKKVRTTLTWYRRRKLARDRDEGEQERLEVMNQLHKQARFAFRPKATKAQLTVFAPPESEPHQRAFWGDAAQGGLEIELLDAEHAELYTPWHRKVIARMLQRHLDEAGG